ncbi:hypothetical protein K3725_10855 [Leisingera sp. S132]|uniref:hypothetical protein n=1 Tax=Leisingera sp. S132 TaxID=2867016 RepID=UPI0021A4069F|nr:hypothetical protein [Leisingera sp. S132]UWQ77820.1 hypothetical protein K3725_10855 [Leisingera sp. S132]
MPHRGAGPRSGGRLTAVLALMLCLLPCASAAGAAGDTPERPPAGLMWNRSGLPAVFPLQVRTPDGGDYYLVLSGSKGDALAAYIRGGEFFKVLVPPGRYALRFAGGAGWQGEARLFGPATEIFELSEPLTFEVRGTGIKAGHRVTLARALPRGGLRAEVTGQFVCQVASLEGAMPRRAAQEGRRGFGLGGDAQARAGLHLRWRLRLTGVEPGTPDARWQRSLFVLGNPNLPRHLPHRAWPGLPQVPTGFRSYSVRSLYCG